MTEKEWLSSEDPAAMLRSLNMRWRSRAYQTELPVDFQRLTLFACACCRRIADLLDHDGQELLGRLERFATREGGGDSPKSRRKEILAIRRAIKKVWRTAYDLYYTTPFPQGASGARYLASLALQHASDLKPSQAAMVAHIHAACAVARRRGIKGIKVPRYICGLAPSEMAAQAGVLREIVGNPYRPSTLDPSWLTTHVLGLSKAIRAEGAFDRAPILADALEEAGCTDGEILTHLRGPGPHLRHCWALDLLRGGRSEA